MDNEKHSVTRSTAMMSAAILVSRITGFVRTWAMAFALGNTLLTSAYSVANNLPNQIFELLAGGIISAVFLPVYMSEREKKGDSAAYDFASNLFSLGLVVLGVVSVLATVFAPQVVFTQTFLSNDLKAEAVHIAIFFFRFFAIQVLLYGLGGLMNSLLNAHREFFWPMVGPIFNNLIVIVTMFSYPFISARNAQAAIVWLAVGTSLGVAVMFAIQLPALLRLKIPLRFEIRLKDTALQESLKMALPVTIFVTVNLIVTSVLNAVSLRIAPSGPATIQYAWLWYQLPYGVIAVALSTALFTEMAEASVSNDMPKLRDNVRFGLRTTLFAIVPLAVAISVLSNSLAALYHAGQFSSDDVAMVAEVLRVWCLALPFFAAYRFMYRAFSSIKDLKLFITVDTCGRVLQVVLYLTLTNGFGSWQGMGLVGLPLADAIAHFLLVSVMLLVLRTKIGSYGLKGIVADGMKMIVAAVVAAVPAFIWRSYFSRPEAQGILAALVSVVFWGLLLLAVYYAILRLLKIPETSTVDRLIGSLRRK